MHRISIIAACGLVCVAGAACGRDTEPAAASFADRIPRLTHSQWEATVQDLFQLPSPPGLATSFQPDPQLGRLENHISRLGVNASLWQDYQRAAETIAARVVSEPALLARWLPDPARADARELAARLGLHAFRRPLDELQVSRYAQLFAGAAAVFPQHSPAVAGVRLLVQAMLQSPYFVYRAELADSEVDGVVPLSGYEVASRLSYLLWNTMPDEALLEAARTGQLDSAEGIRAAASRMLDDPRTRTQLRRFHYQAFAISEYADVDKSPSKFPQWRRELGAMMQEEALRFLDAVVSRGGGVAELLTSTTAFVNADLAKIYGLEGTFGAEFREVELPSSTRAGLLTRAGFLARNATLEDPDPIHRGVFINLDILCRPILAPPSIPPVLDRRGITNRERIDSITGPGTCGEGCHASVINPLGFAFEGYDAIGAHRTTDNGAPVNTADTYVFADGRQLTYRDAVDLSQQLARTPDPHACYASQLVELALGRDLRRLERELVTELAARSLAERLSIQELLLEVVSSPVFRTRARQPRSQP